jgi:hypothetical protein
MTETPVKSEPEFSQRPNYSPAIDVSLVLGPTPTRRRSCAQLCGFAVKVPNFGRADDLSLLATSSRRLDKQNAFRRLWVSSRWLQGLLG